ncbi:brefeldin A sensitivity protein-related, DUF2421 containing protein [Rhodotorula toruloides]|uniref:Brefeldin A sensitivity protein-related, DUF2421 containing protein n=1 Tax=Rhodotorula toruloides TaxID=5286 RepID=A0A511KGJ1_RHOTO|nr:brefeldin A sensitivity protein-related, DUF2421 containing protein [Rhodotorula toruloides]
MTASARAAQLANAAMSAASASRARQRSPQPRFTLDGGEDEDKSFGDEYELQNVRPVPSIVVQPSEATSRLTSSIPGGEGEERDLGREERHVGFAKGAATVIPSAIAKHQGERAGEDGGFVAQGVDEDVRERERAGQAFEPSNRTSKEGERDPAAPFDEPEFVAPAGSTIPVALKRKLPSLPDFLSFAWAKPHLSWKGYRPVVRASVAGWCGLLLMLCGPSERMLGQASFLVLIVAIISPASQPIATALEETFLQFLLAGLFRSSSKYQFTQVAFNAYVAQRYAQPGMSAADVQNAVRVAIFHGEFIEPAASAVCAIFLGVGCGFFLWLRGFLGPGPAIFGIITLTIGVLFPYPYYSIGLIFMIPFACQQAIKLACTFLVFPETLAHQFSDRLIAALQPLQGVIKDTSKMLKANPRTEEWLAFKSIKAGANAAIGGVALMGLSETNLTREISFARISGRDLSMILQAMRVLTARTTGFVFFYEVVEKHLHRDFSEAKGGPTADALVVHLAHSRPGSPDETPGSTRPPSPERERNHQRRESSISMDVYALNHALNKIQHHQDQGHSPVSSSPLSPSHPLPRQLRSRDHSSSSLTDLVHATSHGLSEGRSRTHFPEQHSHRMHYSGANGKRRSRSRGRHGRGSSSHISLPSLLHEVLHPQIDVKPVGVVESTVYADLEDYLHNPRDEQHIEEIIALLSRASGDLLCVLEKSLAHLIETIHRFKSLNDTLRAAFRYNEMETEQLVIKSRVQLDELKTALADFRDTRRLDIVKPFAKLFDPYSVDSSHSDGEELQAPSHRGLFWAFQLQHTLIGWSEALIDVFETTLKIELWFPDWRKARFQPAIGGQDYGDEDPEVLRDLNTQAFSAPRNPDYKAPKNLVQIIGVRLYHVSELATRRDVLFGIKSAILLGLCSLPAMFPGSAWFFYRQRGIWVLIMICLTSNQFLGDVFFGYVVRVWGTLVGAALGLLLWSIAAQRGAGNSFAVGAVCAVAFPFIFFYRVHMQPPMTAILPSVTAMLVIGYSWQDAHNPTLSSVGSGWEVAWRRFICVMLGITIAFIWALLPGSSRQKVTIRRAYAKVIGRMGDVICQILSYANCKEGPTKAPKVIINNLAALRARVNRTVQARAMARYELSLQGPWPSDLYASLQALQMEMLDMLGQFCMVLSKLDTNWTRALLHRTQFANPRFLQDVLQTLQLISNALDHGQPLPFIYNPLLERFLKPPEVLASGRQLGYGYELQLGDEEFEGLPQHVDFKTISSLDYLRFSSGVSQAYALINRLDRLMFVAKSLVGENYLLYGLDASTTRHHPHDEEEGRGMLDDHFHGSAESRRNSFDTQA